MQKIIFTRRGFDTLKEETEKLEKERPAAVLDLKKAREMGDLSENGYYKAAKFKLVDIDRDIRRNKFLLKCADVKTPKDASVVDVGAKVTLMVDQGQREYVLVGEYEANPQEGKISYVSPVGSKLMNKKVDDEIIINLPNRNQIYKILKISIPK